MPTVYIETTIPSYLVARPSRDLVTAAHQQITHDWWDDARHRFDLYVSEAVLEETRLGDPTYSENRLSLVSDLQVLRFTLDVEKLALEYASQLGLGGSAISDVPHFAFAVAYNMDYLLTWNCSHIANGQVIRRLQLVNQKLDRATPVIVTPEELLSNEVDG